MAKLAERIVLSIASTLCVLVMLELGLRGAAHVFLWQQEHGNRLARSATPDRPTILCVGESTTALGGPNAYPRQLAAVLLARGHDVTVVNKGVPGITTDVIIANLPEWIEQYRPQVVVAMMGVNDPPDGEPDVRVPEVVRSLRLYKVGAYIVDGLRRRYATATIDEPPLSPALVEARRVVATKRFDEARAHTEAIVREHPDDVQARLLLARILYAVDDRDGAGVILAALAAEASDDPQRQIAVSRAHLMAGEFGRAREVLERSLTTSRSAAVEVERENVFYSEAEAQTRAGHLEQAAPTLDRAAGLPILHQPYLLHRHRALLAQARGDDPGFRDEFATMARLLAAAPHARTARNFAALRSITSVAGVRLVAVQYPLRSVATLEDALAHDPRIVFVDNEVPFREALDTAPWDAFFTDIFAGDFGHLSPAGNRLLAENVARGVTRAMAWDAGDVPLPAMALPVMAGR